MSVAGTVGYRGTRLAIEDGKSVRGMLKAERV